MPSDLVMLTLPFNIGPYKLVEAIGRGGMAQVYRAQWTGGDGMLMPCAVKMLRPEIAANQTVRRMFLDEARLSMRLQHANICRVLSAAAEPRLHIVMEWVNGMDLAELHGRLQLARQAMPYELILYIVHSLLLALRAAHELIVGGQPHTIIHRDVSPQNVMISIHGEVKLMDFGVARVLVDETRSGNFVGKLRYVPLEQVKGKVTPASDLYALGAVLHELIEGTLFRPDCKTQDEMIAAIYEGHVPVLTRPRVPEVLKKLHDGLLQPDVKDRIQSARQGLTMLGKVSAEQTILGEMVSALLGPQAKTSGSTLGDFPVPAEIADLRLGGDPPGEVVGAVKAESPASPPAPAKPASPAPSSPLQPGEIIPREATVVVTKPHHRAGVSAAGKPHRRPEETIRSIPRSRRWSWVRLVGAAGGEEGESAPPGDASSSDSTPHGAAQDRGAVEVGASDESGARPTDAAAAELVDVATLRGRQESSDSFAVTEVFGIPKKNPKPQAATTAKQVASTRRGGMPDFPRWLYIAYACAGGMLFVSLVMLVTRCGP